MEYILNKKKLEIKIESLFNETIQSFFDEFIPSKKIQHLLIQNKWITMDGNPVKRETDIVGINLEINLYPEEQQKTAGDFKVDIVYEDEIIVIVNKPKGVLVHSDGSDEETLTKWLESYYYDSPWINIQALHRLDKETSGLVMFSKSMIFQPLLDKYLSEKQIRRMYLAIVKGKLEANKTFVINKPIGKDRHDSKKRVVCVSGQPATTKVKSLGCNLKDNYSILRCVLDSGRTHQIRVHLANAGYPILNDELYGTNSKLLVRMGLVADKIEFFHPLKQVETSVECELPKDVEKLFSNLR